MSVGELIGKEEYVKTVAKEERYEMWGNQCEINRSNQNKIICLESRLKSAEKEAEKYRRFWRDELSKKKSEDE